MQQNQFERFRAPLDQFGKTDPFNDAFILGKGGHYSLRYVPFEFINQEARLAIVGITPGNTQIELSYATASDLIKAGEPSELILKELIREAAFGGAAMRPNLIRMLEHFKIPQLLGIASADSLWDENSHLLHGTSVVPHAAFKAGKMFNGSFEEVLNSKLLFECFKDCLAATLARLPEDVLYVALGPTPRAALDWCCSRGMIAESQILGEFCHPSSSGGSAVSYYLREKTLNDLKPNDPVRHRSSHLDHAYRQTIDSMKRISGNLDLSASHQRDQSASERVRPTDLENSIEVKGEAVTANQDLKAIKSTIERAGYDFVKDTKKVLEFSSPVGQTCYVLADSRLYKIKVVVSPHFDDGFIAVVAGPATVKADYFNSNLRRFSKKLNRGETETAYGIQLKFTTLGELSDFLHRFSTTRAACPQ